MLIKLRTVISFYKKGTLNKNFKYLSLYLSFFLLKYGFLITHQFINYLIYKTYQISFIKYRYCNENTNLRNIVGGLKNL